MKKGIHLVWALPLGLVLAYFALVFSTWEWCGISGCSGGGFGRYTADQWMSWICCFIIGALYFLSLVFVKWAEPLRFRVILSAAIGSAIGALVALAYWSALPHG